MALLTSSIADELRRVLLSPQQTASLEVRGHTKAAVLVALYLDQLDGGTDGLHVVLTRRREGLRRHPGEISFPGGRCEQGEHDLRATALREAEEEIGLPANDVQMVGALRPTPTLVTGYAIHPFVAMIESGRRWTLSADEVAEVIEVPVRVLRCGYASRRLIRHRIPIRTDTFVVDHHLIWGATARILTDLLQRLQGIGPLPEPLGGERAQPFSIGAPTKLPHSVQEPS